MSQKHQETAVTKQRISKRRLLDQLRDLESRANRQFNPNDGWSQVHGKGEQINRDYSQWKTIEMIRVLIENGKLG